MPTLSLFRHAKSSWENPKLDDFDRPLDARGRNAAPAMGAHMRVLRLAPDLVLCSPAARTRETVELAFATWPSQPKIQYEDSLYLASPQTLLSCIRRTPEPVHHLMLVGHNPGLEDLAAELVGKGPSKARKRMASKFPTAALAVIDFEGLPWAEISEGTGELRLFVTPKMLDSK
jgi:phosphohistidine phosphatase